MLFFQREKDELGFWDSAVDAVITDQKTVTNRMSQPVKGSTTGTDADKVNPSPRNVIILYQYLSPLSPSSGSSTRLSTADFKL